MVELTVSTLILLALVGLALCGACVYLLVQYGANERKISRVRRMLGNARTECEKLEQAGNSARRETKWYESLFNSTEEMVLVFPVEKDGMPGKFLAVSDIACSCLEYSRSELMESDPTVIELLDTAAPVMGYNKSDLVALSDDYIQNRENRYATRSARRLVSQVMENGVLQYETTFKTRTGRQIPVEVKARKVDFNGRSAVACTARDLTERERAEQALSASESRFQEFFANSPIGIVIYDGDKKVADVNRSCLRMFGIPDKVEFAKFSLFDNPYIPETHRKKLREGEATRYEAAVDFSEVLEKAMFVTSRSGTAYFDVMISRMRTGSDFRPVGYFAQVQDITERRKTEAELSKRDGELRQAEKMEALGSMAGGVAHDFNNILTPIVGYARMIERSAAEEDPCGKYAGNISKAANRAKDLVGQILTFSRKSDGDEQENRPIHVIPIAKEVLKLQGSSAPENVGVRRTIKTENDVVKTTPTKIHQVLMNLCTNAVHAMREDGGEMELIATDITVGKRPRRRYQELPPGRYLQLSVRDTGAGMDKATAARIFEPFFTTKKSGEGTGMGLSVVHGIVKGMGGAITVESEPGKGSVFNVVLPVTEVTEETDAGAAEDMATGSGRILVVDDDAEVTELICDMLESLGYEATPVNNGYGAMKLFRMDPSHFDAVILDEVMPGMPGHEAAREMLKIREGMPIMICTGYSQAFSANDAREAGVREFITKPIAMEEMAAALRRALEVKKGAE
ncbi:MAG: ATP-binding protein [Kiritimatiellia bacterium]